MSVTYTLMQLFGRGILQMAWWNDIVFGDKEQIKEGSSVKHVQPAVWMIIIINWDCILISVLCLYT